MNIENRNIGLGERPFIVAEMSANHGGSLERALKLVRAAAESGMVNVFTIFIRVPKHLGNGTKKYLIMLLSLVWLHSAHRLIYRRSIF